MDTNIKNQIDMIIALAPAIAAVAGPAVPTAAAFDSARDFVNRGDVDAALYLLKNFPDLTSDNT